MRIRGELFFVEYLKHLDGRQRDTCAGAEDGGYAGLVEEVVVLSGNHTACSNEDILAAKFLELLDNLRNQGLVSCGER